MIGSRIVQAFSGRFGLFAVWDGKRERYYTIGYVTVDERTESPKKLQIHLHVMISFFFFGFKD